jgi:signal transduction histidine kinase
MPKSREINNDILDIPQTSEDLAMENQRLLNELESAYVKMERILEESNQEKKIAYSELQKKFDSLENLYQELSNKENLLIHMEKLSSIGQFITELIHELSSPLTAITLQTQLAALKEHPVGIKKQFKNVEEQAEKMSNLLNRFKSMAYKGKEAFKEFDLNQNVQECVETVEIIKPKSMNLKTEYCTAELPVKGDPYQTNQIFLNLAKNAFDAMEDFGNILWVKTHKLTSDNIFDSDLIGLSFCQPEEEWEKILAKSNQFALVEFQDTGSGIPDDIMCEIFQPFFTTKERGKGTGLGLAISRDIAVRHGGNLAVKSKLGEGTTFQFLLPLNI